MKWIKFFRIKNFEGLFSRNEHMPKSEHSPCIINLDNLEGPGTHWVCCFPSLNNRKEKIFCIILTLLVCHILRSYCVKEKNKS